MLTCLVVILMIVTFYHNCCKAKAKASPKKTMTGWQRPFLKSKRENLYLILLKPVRCGGIPRSLESACKVHQRHNSTLVVNCYCGSAEESVEGQAGVSTEELQSASTYQCRCVSTSKGSPWCRWVLHTCIWVPGVLEL